jgi:GTP-binding protein
VADLAEPGQSVIVARGGEGGWGNTHFASSTNKSPRIAKKGGTDEEHSLVLELRLIADAGIVGYPNVGKSALLAAASAAKPKIADYAFTTRQPELGVVEVGNQRFTLAEIPGLIDGAHLGRGLGHDFLRHAMRTKMLIHVVDGSSASPVEDMVRVNNELTLFDSSLSHKPQLVAVNKIDLPQVRARLAEIEAALIASGNKPHFISALTGAGVPELMAETARVLQSMATEGRAGEPLHKKVFRPQPRGRAAQVTREGDIFVVIAPELERIIAGSDVSDLEVQLQLRKQLARMGISRALEKAGVKPGDKVRCGELEWEW